MPGVLLALERRRVAAAGRHRRARRAALTDLREETMRVGEVELSLLRPAAPEELLDEEAFEHDEFLPYWAELWPAASALAAALPADLDGVRVVELGCGLGVPSLVAAAAGREVVATDWAADAIDLLRQNAERNGITLAGESLGLARPVGGAVRPRPRRRRPLRAAQRRAGRRRPATARPGSPDRPRRPPVRAAVPEQRRGSHRGSAARQFAVRLDETSEFSRSHGRREVY